MTWGNVSNDYAESYGMTTEYVLVDENAVEEANITTYYWLNVPVVKAGGPYKGNVTIKVNRTS